MPKAKRKCYSIATKLHVLDAFREQENVSAVVKQFGIGQQQVRAWRAQEDKWTAAAKRGRKHGMARKMRRLPYTEHCKFQDMEELLFQWVKEQ